MQRWVIVLGVGLLAGCPVDSDKPSPPAKSSSEGRPVKASPPKDRAGQPAEQRPSQAAVEHTANVMSKMRELRDRACGCDDAECIDEVLEVMNRWGAEMQTGEGSLDVPEDQSRQMTAIADEMSKCMTKHKAPPP